MSEVDSTARLTCKTRCNISSGLFTVSWSKAVAGGAVLTDSPVPPVPVAHSELLICQIGLVANSCISRPCHLVA
jgi:hypothetical protein